MCSLSDSTLMNGIGIMKIMDFELSTAPRTVVMAPTMLATQVGQIDFNCIVLLEQPLILANLVALKLADRIRKLLYKNSALETPLLS